MTDINKNRYQCTGCEIWFDPENAAYGTDEDGNHSCVMCCKDIIEFQGWGLFQDYPTEWHIRPIDEPDHLHDKICSCNPSVETVNGIDLVKHSSFDGREGLEEAMNLLNNL